MALGKKTGGRVKGTPNKATADIKAAASKHGPEMIRILASIARSKKQPPQARTAAAVALLDRGFGKPAQELQHTGAGGRTLADELSELNKAAAARAVAAPTAG